MIAANKRGDIDFQNVRSFNLDEYYPMKPENDQSYDYFMNENLFSSINMPKENHRLPNGMATDPDEECRNYDNAIEAAGGIDLQVLGLGVNGHIGFNEPDEFLIPETHTVTLTESTRLANARFFQSLDEVPDRALTMGFSSIMRARQIILLANGEGKADAIAQMVSGNVGPQFPASILRLHANVTVICDKAAGAKIGKLPNGVTLTDLTV